MSIQRTLATSLLCLCSLAHTTTQASKYTPPAKHDTLDTQQQPHIKPAIHLDNEQQPIHIKPAIHLGNEHQRKTMLDASNIARGLHIGDRSLIFKHIQALQKRDVSHLSNPKIILDKLLDALASNAIDWEHYGIKRLIAQQLIRLTHAVYHCAQRNQHKIHSTQDKAKMLQKLQKALDMIDEQQAPGNGYRCELETTQAMIEALPDTDNWLDTWGDSVFGIYEFVKDRDITKLSKLAKTCYRQIRKAQKVQWYQVVLYIDFLQHKALKSKDRFKELQNLLYIYKQKRIDSKIGITDVRGNWHILWKGIDALTYIIAESRIESIVHKAMYNDDKELPGISYYRDFNKISVCGIKTNNWRVREKAFESLIMLSEHANAQLAKHAKAWCLACRTQEQDSRVLLIVAQPQIIIATQQAMRQDWSSYTAGVQKQLNKQTHTFEQLLDKHAQQQRTYLQQHMQQALKDLHQRLDAQQQTLQDIQQLCRKPNADDIQAYLEEQRNLVTTLLAHKGKHTKLVQGLYDSDSDDNTSDSNDNASDEEKQDEPAQQAYQSILQELLQQQRKQMQWEVMQLQNIGDTIDAKEDIARSCRRKIGKLWDKQWAAHHARAYKQRTRAYRKYHPEQLTLQSSESIQRVEQAVNSVVINVMKSPKATTPSSTSAKQSVIGATNCFVINDMSDTHGIDFSSFFHKKSPT